jgi:eukaryotic-like serine/threonine-protein kinase
MSDTESEPRNAGDDDAQASLAGMRFGPYEIVEEIGRGGMATVYAANDVRHKRRVALKVLDPRIASTLGADRFLREIGIAARLTHPHIVPLHDSGEAHGSLYYVMPYVVGESLRARLARTGPLPVSEALRYGAEIAEALDYAHRHGVVHRDVKPENVILTEGHCVVLDFGIARAIHEAAGDRLTTHGMLLGTPAYMSPEQAGGEREIDARSDVFSLGVTLYEMLTSTSPFAAPTAAATLARVLTAPVPPVRSQRADVPAHVEDVLNVALHKKPSGRFQTAGAMAGRLQTIVGSVATPAPAPRRGTRALIAAGFVAAVLGAAFLVRQGLRADPNEAALPADSANAYFASGIAEELLNALSDVPGLRVASRSASFAPDIASSDLRAVGRALGVTTVLEGSVRRAGETLRVTARLVNAGDGSVIWTSSIDGASGAVFDVQERIARTIVERLQLRLTSEAGEIRLVRRRTHDPRAFDLVLRARSAARTSTRSGLLEAAQLLHEALARDSSYTETHAQLADVYEALAVFGDQRGLPGGATLTPGDMLRQARLAAQRAVELDSLSASAHVALGTLIFRYDWDWSAAERELQRALDLQPALSTAHLSYSRFLRSMGRFQESRARLDSAHKYDRQSERSWEVAHGRIAFFARDYERAIRETRAGFNPNDRLDAVWLAQAYTFASRYAEAESVLTTLPSDDRSQRSAMAYLFARTGREREARALLGLIRGSESALPTIDAGVLVALGDTAGALDELDRAIRARDPLIVDMKVSPWLDPLRRHPRFVAIMQRLAFPE